MAQEVNARQYVPIIVDETPKFDLENYISNYAGRTRFRRLYLIGLCSTALRLEALRAAVQEAKSSSDLADYQNAAATLKQVDSAFEVDQKWLDQKKKQVDAETKRLEHELKGYKNNLIKESIRMGNEELGTHYMQLGDMQASLKAFSRMRDYCTTPMHIATTALHIVLVSLEQSNFLAIQSQVQKIRNLQMKQEDAAKVLPKCNVAMGLSQMGSGEYKDAARSFLNTDPSLGETYNEVCTANDVAVYGGLCALASFDRAELQSKVLDNNTFRSFLELEPHIRRAINCFVASKYKQCLEILESYRADYLLDIYLQREIPVLYNMIRTKAIVQYFEPFSKVTLDAMAQTFGAPNQTSGINGTTNGTTLISVIQDELIQLIESGTLNARIDLEHGVLIANSSNLRNDVHDEALKMTQAYIREARLRILRMNAVQAGLEVKSPPKKAQGTFLEGLDMNSGMNGNGFGRGMRQMRMQEGQW